MVKKYVYLSSENVNSHLLTTETTFTVELFPLVDSHTHTRIRVVALVIEAGQSFDARSPLLTCRSHAANATKIGSRMMLATTKLNGVYRTDAVTTGEGEDASTVFYERSTHTLDNSLVLEFNTVMQNIELEFDVFGAGVSVERFFLDAEDAEHNITDLFSFELVLEYETYTP